MSLYNKLPKIETSFIEGDIPKQDFGEVVHIDLETTGLSPVESDICVVNIGYDPIEDGTFTKALVLHCYGLTKSPPRLKSLLVNKKVLKVIHNAAFDATFINYNWGMDVTPVNCTKVLAKKLKCRTSYKALVKMFCGYEIPKGSITVSKWETPFEEWSEDMKKYCAYDVAFGYKILQSLTKLSSKEDLSAVEKVNSCWPYLVKILPILDSHEDLKLVPR